jgi:DNA-binding NarL/FixJ family response regulator
MKALLVDDHALFRDGLSLLMTQRFPDVELFDVGAILDAEAVLDSEAGIELILLDLGLPDSQGLDSLQRLRLAAPEASMVVMSADDRPETILAAIDQGAAGFIPKTARLGAIESALRVVLDGGIFLPQGIYRCITPQADPVPDVSGLDPAQVQAALVYSLGLSRRQVDVLRLLVMGCSTKLISRKLQLAESTVKTHLIGLFRKLDVNSRTQAIIAAARVGLTFDR